MAKCVHDDEPSECVYDRCVIERLTAELEQERMKYVCALKDADEARQVAERLRAGLEEVDDLVRGPSHWAMDDLLVTLDRALAANPAPDERRGEGA